MCSQFHILQTKILTHVVIFFQACLMLSLESDYPPAHQLALDMLKVQNYRLICGYFPRYFYTFIALLFLCQIVSYFTPYLFGCSHISLSFVRIFLLSQQASVAQLDAPSDWRPGDRGFSPRRGRQHSFVEIDREIFSAVILSLPLIQEGQLSVSGERMCTLLVNRLED